MIDIHCDVWTDVLKARQAGGHRIIEKRHLARFKDAGLAGGVFAVWNDEPARAKERLTEGINAMNAELWESRDIVRAVRTQGDFYGAVDEGKLAVILSLEGLEGIGEDVDWMYTFSQLGFSLVGLTWNEQNQLATGTAGDEARGLTETGRRAVQLCQQLGMLVDVSHLNDRSFWDVAEISHGPIVASHSNARSLCDMARNLTDEQIKTIGQSGGLIGINAFHEFVSRDDSLRTLDHLIDHIVHIANLIGIGRIGFGFDFFEYLSEDTIEWITTETYKGTRGFETLSKSPALLARLCERGFTEAEVRGLAYENFISLLPK